MIEKIKIGIIGCGNISSIYFENLTKTFGGTEVYACSDLVPERSAHAAKLYGIPHVMTTEEILACPEIKIILNLTVPKQHYGVSKAALLSGKHVYVEKPLTLSMDEANELSELAASKGLMLCNAPDTFLGGGLQTCIKLIKDGFIGKPVSATAFMTCHGHESWHPDPEFYYEAGGGPMFDMGPYYLTALIALLGPAKTVCGMTRLTYPERVITSEKKFGKVIKVEVPTHVTGAIEFENGAIATLITSFDIWASTLPRIEIYGSAGTLIVPDPNTFGGPVMLRTSHGNEFSEIPLTHIYNENSRGIGIADMAACLISGELPKTSHELGRHVLEIMHAFHESSSTKQYTSLKTSCEQPSPLPLGLIKGFVR